MSAVRQYVLVCLSDMLRESSYFHRSAGITREAKRLGANRFFFWPCSKTEQSGQRIVIVRRGRLPRWNDPSCV